MQESIIRCLALRLVRPVFLEREGSRTLSAKSDRSRMQEAVSACPDLDKKVRKFVFRPPLMYERVGVRYMPTQTYSDLEPLSSSCPSSPWRWGGATWMQKAMEGDSQAGNYAVILLMNG